MLSFIDKVDERYGGKDVPHFLVGQSMGGFLSAALAVEAPEKFAGISLLVPLFDFYDDTAIQKALPMAKMLNMFMPAY